MTSRVALFLFIAVALVACRGKTPPKKASGKPRPHAHTKPERARPPAPKPPTPPPAPPPLADLATPIEAADPPAGAGAAEPNFGWTATTPLLTWVEEDPLHPRTRVLRMARIQLEGWSPPSTIATDDAFLADPANVPALARGDGLTLVAAWSQTVAKAGASAVALARSDDSGATWRRIGLAHDDGTATEHGFMTVLPGSGPRVLWLDGRETVASPALPHASGATTLRTAVVGSQDDLLHEAARLDDRVCDCCQLDATQTVSGAVVVYRDRTADDVRDISILRLVDGKWTSPRPVHVDGWRIPGCPVDGPAVTAFKRRIVVAWFTAAGDTPRVLVAFSEDGGASFGKPIEVDSPFERRIPIGHVDVELLGPDAVVTWVAARREDAALLVRRVAPDGKRSPLLQIAAVPNRREAGAPHMLWFEPSSELIFAWTDPSPPSRVRVARFNVANLPAVTAEPPKAPRPAAAPAGLAVGQPAPELAVHTLDGTPVSLAASKGQVVVVNLWATWCEPCRREIPALTALAARHQAAGLRVVGISVDRARKPAEIAAAAAELGATYELWHDPADTASTAFAVPWLPATFVIGKDGKVAWQRVGAVATDDPGLERAVTAALAADGT